MSVPTGAAIFILHTLIKHFWALIKHQVLNKVLNKTLN